MMYDLSSCNRILTTPIPLSYTVRAANFHPRTLLSATANENLHHQTSPP
jgi:predicted membrane chloride channel (bestrophin family)